MLDKAKIVVLAAADLLRQDEGVGVHFNDVITFSVAFGIGTGKEATSLPARRRTGIY